MTFKRIASVAACLLVGTASFSLHAQSLISKSIASLTPPQTTFEQFVPAYLSDAIVPAPASASTVQHSDDWLFALENDQFESNINAAVTTQVLFRAPRKRVADLAMRLRDIRYVRAGRDPVTGFDCSGFTHYVYHQTYGLNLPYDAPGQYRDGQTVSPERMRTGDLVFFHVGKRITHVGIYLGDGQFIHSPSPGKHVRVDKLDSTYWAKRFAGAKRPNVLS